jgi:hypothetical protein
MTERIAPRNNAKELTVRSRYGACTPVFGRRTAPSVVRREFNIEAPFSSDEGLTV